jgi:hypothetical protein
MPNVADDDNTNDDLDEHFLLDSSSTSSKEKQKPLIPKECATGDEFAGTCSFVDEFNKRYGPMTPLFFIGTLEDAIKEALLCPAKDRKLLGIYLHSDHTVFCNIFCAKTMCDENVVILRVITLSFGRGTLRSKSMRRTFIKRAPNIWAACSQAIYAIKKTNSRCFSL